MKDIAMALILLLLAICVLVKICHSEPDRPPLAAFVVRN